MSTTGTKVQKQNQFLKNRVVSSINIKVYIKVQTTNVGWKSNKHAELFSSRSKVIRFTAFKNN